MALNENIVEDSEILVLMLRRLMVDYPYRSSKKLIKELYSTWVYMKSSETTSREHANMLTFTDMLKDFLRQANQILKEKKDR